MKKDIHPKWFETTVTCACGSVYHTHATKPQLRVEVCANCHPFYTGQQRMVDAGGQVDRFMRKLARVEQIQGRSEQKEASTVTQATQ
jgi:large subunit ribosomal protein L31